jgi:flagellar export protein FliJ
MAGFRFTLQPVLDMRQRAEQECQAEVGRIMAERRELESTLASYQRQIDACKGAQRDAMRGDGQSVTHVDPAELRVQAAATLGLHAKAQRAAIKLAGVLTRLDRAKATLTESSRARRAVEILRDRRREEWKREQARRENAELDDLAGRAAPGAMAFQEVRS